MASPSSIASRSRSRRISPERLEALKRSLIEDPAMLLARPLIALMDRRVICGSQRLAVGQLDCEAMPGADVDFGDACARASAAAGPRVAGEGS